MDGLMNYLTSGRDFSLKCTVIIRIYIYIYK